MYSRVAASSRHHRATCRSSTAARATRGYVKSTVTPPFSRIRSISRMSQISSTFLDKKCDLYSGKYGMYIMVGGELDYLGNAHTYIEKKIPS